MEEFGRVLKGSEGSEGSKRVQRVQKGSGGSEREWNGRKDQIGPEG